MLETEETFATPLKEAIRVYWHADKQLRMAQEGKEEPRVITFYQRQVDAQEALIKQIRQQTTTLVLTGEDDCDYGDHQVDLGAIEMLLQKGIIHECLYCEEREDLADCYDGDHREFHLSGDHSGYCIDKALHEYDPTRWPEFVPPHDEEVYDCKECGIVAVPL
jgi:hypothetical protein